MSVNEGTGYRDAILARSAETYLMAAEAEARLAALGAGSYAVALGYVNTVRERATYKGGEDSSAYTDGADAYTASAIPQDPHKNSFLTDNAYYESTHIQHTK